MSFSLKVKNEICRYTDLSKKEAIAEVSAIMKASGTLGLGSNKSLTFKVITENPAIARLLFKILKEHFNLHTKLLVKRSNSLKKNNVYVVVIPEDIDVRTLLEDVGVLKREELFTINYGVPESIIEEEESKRAYIRICYS